MPPLSQDELVRAYLEDQALFVPEPQVWAHCDMLRKLYVQASVRGRSAFRRIGLTPETPAS